MSAIDTITSASSTRAYFSFRDYLTEAEAAQFFELPHRAQVLKVTQYLDFLGQQPVAAHFTASARASTSFAALRASRSWFSSFDLRERQDGVSADQCIESGVAADTTESTKSSDASKSHSRDADGVDTAHALQELVDGRTRSGFGAFGTELGFLPQKQLSLAVAAAVEEIGHEYVVERTKRGGEVCAPVLNSRSFFFYWCHAEKQKLLDIRIKLDRIDVHLHDRTRWRRALWHELVVVVDRAMCLDCIRFATNFARAEQISLVIEDPDVLRVFPSDTAQSVQCLPLR